VIERSSVVTRNDDLVTAPLGAELAMMDVDSGTYYVLDDVASFIWSRISGAVRVADLLEELEGRYEVTRDECERDVLGLLRRMQEKGAVRVVG